MPGPKRALTESEVLTAAFDVLAEGGLPAVSIRAVAGRLAISPNSVYTYVDSKAALVQAMAEELLAELLPRRGGRAGDGRRRLVALAGRIREHLLGRPGATAVIMAAPLTGPHALALGEEILTAFTMAGLGTDDAARASYAFQVQVLGTIALAEAGPSDRPAPDLDAYPLTKASWQVVASYDTAAQFRWSVDRLLDGLIGS